MRICGKHWAKYWMTVALASVALAGCGGGEESTAGGADNLAPLISGTPTTSLNAGSPYSFQPQASDPDGDPLVFSAENLPRWAAINSKTGAVTGTPAEADVGMTGMITVMVSDSKAISELPEFRIQVSSAATVPPPATNHAPTIVGTPPTTATVGQVYSFTPVGDDADDDTLTFSIQNKPAWATFNTATGRLSGTPALADVLTYSNIIISVSDGTTSVPLPSFNLAVVQAVTGSVTLNWVAPLTNTDGSALDLAGYRVSYGRSATSLDQVAQITNPGLVTYTIDNLAAGTWYFTIRAYSNTGAQSDPSNVASKTIQ